MVFLLEEAAYFGLVVVKARGYFVQLGGAFIWHRGLLVLLSSCILMVVIELGCGYGG